MCRWLRGKAHQVLETATQIKPGQKLGDAYRKANLLLEC